MVLPHEQIHIYTKKHKRIWCMIKAVFTINDKGYIIKNVLTKLIMHKYFSCI